MCKVRLISKPFCRGSVVWEFSAGKGSLRGPQFQRYYLKMAEKNPWTWMYHRTSGVASSLHSITKFAILGKDLSPNVNVCIIVIIDSVQPKEWHIASRQPENARCVY
jgi:hypothetical protein